MKHGIALAVLLAIGTASAAEAQTALYENCTFRLASAHLSGRQPNESKAHNDIIKACSDYVMRNAGDNRKLSEAYRARGDAFLGKGDPKRAMADWNLAIKLDPSNGAAHASRGKNFFEQEKYGDAVRDLTTAINLGQQSDYVFARRAAAYLELENYKAAIEDLTDSLRHDAPDFIRAGRLKDRAYAYYQEKQFERAIADIDRAEQIDDQPLSWRFFYLRAHSCETIGRRECAVENFKKMYEAAPQQFKRDAVKARVESLGGRM